MTEWYFQGTDGERAGPVDQDTFQKMRAEGQLTDETLVWRKGMKEWTPLGTVPERNTSSTSPAESNATTQSTPAATTFANCTVCNEPWPVNLLQGPEKNRICGICIRKEGAKPTKAKKKVSSSSGAGIDYGWGRWLLKVVVLSMLLLLAYGVLRYPRYKIRQSQRALERFNQDAHSERLPQKP